MANRKMLFVVQMALMSWVGATWVTTESGSQESKVYLPFGPDDRFHMECTVGISADKAELTTSSGCVFRYYAVPSPPPPLLTDACEAIIPIDDSSCNPAGSFNSDPGVLIWRDVDDHRHTSSLSGEHDFYDGTWAHILPERNLGSISCGVQNGKSNGGFSGTTTAELKFIIGCANHGGAGNEPVIAGGTSLSWEDIGKSNIGPNHNPANAITNFITVLPAGTYTICCSKQWATGAWAKPA